MKGPRRIVVAAGLSAAAVLVPCVAWYTAGSAGASREAARLRAEALEQAGDVAEVAALRVAARLEERRETEAACPAAHYPSGPGDGEDACDCPPPEPGWPEPSHDDPLVRARFEVDPSGVLTVVRPGVTGGELDGGLVDALRSLTPALLGSMHEAPYRTEVLEPEAPSPYADATHGYGRTGDPELLSQGPFRWRTVALDGTPTLVGIRDVRTAGGGLVQGFVVDHGRLDRWLEEGGLDARAVHGSASAPGEADVPIATTAWRVVTDPGEALGAAARRAKAVRRRFLGSFALGAAGALVAAASLVTLLWQSDRLSRMRARFAAAAAHELKSPLASIRLHGDLLAQSLGRPEQTREYAARVSEEVERLERVVENVLGYARMGEGRRKLRLESGDVAEAVASALAGVQPALDAAGALLEVVRDDGLPPARFDAEALGHVVRNLVDNAEKFSRASNDRTILVRVVEAGGDVEVRVEDRGPGVRGEARSRLFDGRAANAGGGSSAGLGLGLQLSRALVAAMGGTIRYEAREGGGATFIVRLRADRSLVIDGPD